MIKKYTISVKKSNITKIESWRFEIKSFVIKSIEINNQGCFRIGRDWKSLLN